MNEINLKIETKTVECEIFKIKSAITIQEIEEVDIEIVIPKKIRKEIEKQLIEELNLLFK